jgi:hypothetical protein
MLTHRLDQRQVCAGLVSGALGLGVDEQIDERQMMQVRFWVGNRRGYARLLIATPVVRPRSRIFNCYSDIPIGRVG